MASEIRIDELIYSIVKQHPGIQLEELATLCPNFTWNQVFLEVDRLSRLGQVRLYPVGPGRYGMEICTVEESRAGAPPVRKDCPNATGRERQDQDARKCERCDGLMVRESFNDEEGWRCVLCGERVDAVIFAHRQRGQGGKDGEKERQSTHHSAVA